MRSKDAYKSCIRSHQTARIESVPVGEARRVGTIVLAAQLLPYEHRTLVELQAGVASPKTQSMDRLASLGQHAVGAVLRAYFGARHVPRQDRTPKAVVSSFEPTRIVFQHHSPWLIVKAFRGVCKYLVLYVCLFGSPEVIFLDIPYLFAVALLETLRGGL